ncbi:MAG: ribosome small subunit-dependent GTPase A [Candidatus Kapabacteria bacterium]|nr:ribosome small subunit-dependent GTPase A [Candidatus Kapabacteria bacterium]
MANFGDIYENRKDSLKKKKFVKRVLIKENGKTSANAMEGKVIAAEGKYFYIKTKDEIVYEGEPGGTLISPNPNASLVAVGDDVFFKPVTHKTEFQAKILKIKKRRSQLARRAVGQIPFEHVIASNIENVIIFMSAAEPFYNKKLIDRLIIAADLGDMNPVIFINKIDLMPRDAVLEDLSVYFKLGIPCILFSVKSGENLDQMKTFLQGKNSVLVGYSGVGKSTLINSIIGTDLQSTSIVSYQTGKGKHTTSAVRMFNIPEGGTLIDTPGIREFALWGLLPDQLTFFFKEFDELFQNCKYNPCTHTHEPDCAVKAAVDAEIIDFDRYQSYLNILDSLINDK